ncbi:MAG: hypothetical protein GX684_05860 [Ruminococcaceae bacterium]|nr:hypothetical protein [Oscillospiraceae bacterium]
MKRKYSILLLLVFSVLCYITLSSPVGAYSSESTHDVVAGAKLSVGDYRGMSKSYDVQAAKNKGGVVNPSVSDCAPGTVVKIGIVPDGGFEPGSVCVITAFGDALEVFLDGDQYCFVMPEAPVVIYVSFQLLRT